MFDIDEDALPIGAALLANSKGYAAGALTSGPELGRIDQGLGFI